MRFGVFSALFVLFLAAPAFADPPPEREAAVQARPHFEQALSLYRAGKYRLAIVELHAALELDPAGKDLVFNLALVQEKLGDLPGAIVSLERFQTMEKDPAELERAGQTIQRLQGAQAELLASAARAPAPGRLPLADCAPTRVRGKADAWVIGSGSVSFAALLLGAAFGVQALTLAGEGRTDDAQSAAVVADLAFGASLVTGVGAAALYFGRYADPIPAQNGAFLPLPKVSAAALTLSY